MPACLGDSTAKTTIRPLRLKVIRQTNNVAGALRLVRARISAFANAGQDARAIQRRKSSMISRARGRVCVRGESVCLGTHRMGSNVSCKPTAPRWPASGAAERRGRELRLPAFDHRLSGQCLWVRGAQSRRQPRPSACVSTIRPSRTSLGPREKNRAAPSAIFFPKPESDFAALGRRGAFLSATPFLLLGQLGSDCLA
jgi:hypothetical protein